MERIDILVVSISTAALGFSMTFIKDLIPDLATKCLTLLKISWFLFGAAIIFNLLSQLTSYYANRLEYKIVNNIINPVNGELMP